MLVNKLQLRSRVRGSRGPSQGPQVPIRGTLGVNQSPKGNMWSAIPDALLCMIVNLSEGKQGSGLEGDEVL